jgi:cytochrome c oxidase cbb3-type subunit III
MAQEQHVPDVDHVTGTATTGHDWDGIKELNTPLPKWWLYSLYGTIIWAIGYIIVYPAIPLATSFTKGTFGWSSRGAVMEELADLKVQRGGMLDAISKASLADIEKDPKMLSFALALAKPAFGDNCAPCHGAGGGGAKGYPNLNDDDWLWGGKAEDIHTTLLYGIRSGDAKAREGGMPAFGRDGLLKKDEIANVADYTRTLSGLPADKTADLVAGKKVFAENCAACHGDEGKGNLEMGAPNLTDKIWLYGSDKAAIVEGLTNGRNGVMPGWSNRLDATTIKALAVYVHTLGGGK